MNKNLGYPVKYAVLELRESGGFANGYEELTRGFIVSKCYLVEGSVRFLVTGNHEILYKVVFPFKNNPHYELNSQNIDDRISALSGIDGVSYSVDIVSDIFDNYEEASLLAEQKNKILKAKLILKVSVLDQNWKTQFRKLNVEFQKKLAICQKIEKVIASKTKNMDVSKERFDICVEAPKRKVMVRKARTLII